MVGNECFMNICILIQYIREYKQSVNVLDALDALDVCTMTFTRFSLAYVLLYLFRITTGSLKRRFENHDFCDTCCLLEGVV